MNIKQSLHVEVNGVEPETHMDRPSLWVDPNCSCIHWLLKIDPHLRVPIVTPRESPPLINLFPLAAIGGVGYFY